MLREAYAGRSGGGNCLLLVRVGLRMLLRLCSSVMAINDQLILTLSVTTRAYLSICELNGLQIK
jgi:hypothetical protein